MHAIRFFRWLDASLLLWAAAGACSQEPLDPSRRDQALANDAGCEADCEPAPGDSAGDACGPAGEGAIPFSDCNPNLGLRCTPPPTGVIDAPPTCECRAGQTFSLELGACAGAALGERPGDACSEDGQNAAACNAQRKLHCASAQCACEPNTEWSEPRLQCLSECARSD